MPTLKKTQTSQRVVYTGMNELAGMVIIVDKNANMISLHQTIVPLLVGSKTWQQLCAEIEAANTIT